MKGQAVDTILVIAEFAANNSVYYTLRMSPFSVVYSWNPEIHKAPTRDESREGRVPAVAEAVKRMREADQTLRSRWQHAMEIQLRAQNSRQRP
ncbi:MAG: hypothetical protein FE78DRAFT_40418 [Acidomyces sp. 'richmondensis']|nr:MAG: hypothetical protein FE78DRAFT_40418 [Acidomyces sp. 'richmondensis']